MRKIQIFLACISLTAFVLAAGPAAWVNTADAAVVHQGTSSNYQDEDLSGSGIMPWPHTVSAGSDRLLVVTTSIDSNSGTVVTAVTFGGHLLTRRVQSPNGAEQVQLWYMLAPPVGTFDVEVEYGGGSRHFGLEAIASNYIGVSQNRPISAVNAKEGTTINPNERVIISVDSSNGELVIDALGYRNSGTMSAVAGQTEHDNISHKYTGGAASEKASAGTNVDMSWDLENPGKYSLLAASLRPAPPTAPTVRTVTVKPFGAGDYSSLNEALNKEAANLVNLNRQLNIELHAMTDTAAIDLVTPGYVTDPDHFIFIYVTASDRHEGAWDSSKYNLNFEAQIVPAVSTTQPACISIGEVDIWLDGLQAECRSPASDEFPSMIAAAPGSSGHATLRISNSIFKGNWMVSNGAKNANFMALYDWPATSEMWVWNTIATDFWWADQSKGRGLHTAGTQGGEIWWSNVTLAHLANATSNLNIDVRLHVRNSLASLSSPGESWSTALPGIVPDSDYNASNLNTETLVGANSLANQIFSFQGPDDWRLSFADFGAADNGITSLNSYYINGGLDVSGQLRDTMWDIGASEFVAIDTTDPVTIAVPPGGSYTTPQNVALIANEPATIYYTTDGSVPTTFSAVYSGPISLASDATLQYFAQDTAGNSEAVNIEDYTFTVGGAGGGGGGGSTGGGGGGGGCFISSVLSW